MCIYIYMHVCIYFYFHIHIFVFIYIYTCIIVYIYIHIYLHIYIFTHVHVCIYISLYTYIRICKCRTHGCRFNRPRQSLRRANHNHGILLSDSIVLPISFCLRGWQIWTFSALWFCIIIRPCYMIDDDFYRVANLRPLWMVLLETKPIILPFTYCLREGGRFISVCVCVMLHINSIILPL